MTSRALDSLLPLEMFASIFESFQRKRIGYIRPTGNVGDLLIELSMIRLFEAFQIHWRPCDPEQMSAGEFDELVFGGGGNMGRRSLNNWRLRSRALTVGLPVTILPQSFTTPEDRPFQRVFVRERASLSLYPNGILAPDLALALPRREFGPPQYKVGIFLRRDPERLGGWRWFARDPARLCRTPEEYQRLAGRYEHIVTDRLHFAICGLLAGRRTTLLANNYHKNRSMFETWLQRLGCEFASDLRQAPWQWRWQPAWAT